MLAAQPKVLLIESGNTQIPFTDFRGTSSTARSQNMGLSRSSGISLDGTIAKKKCTLQKFGLLLNLALAAMVTTPHLAGRVLQVAKTLLNKTGLMPSAKDCVLSSSLSGKKSVLRSGSGWAVIQKNTRSLQLRELKHFAQKNIEKEPLIGSAPTRSQTRTLCENWVTGSAPCTRKTHQSRPGSAANSAENRLTCLLAASFSVGMKPSRLVPAILASLLVMFASASMATEPTLTATSSAIPKNAIPLLPILREKQLEIWPDAPIPSFLAAQIEQESCVSLRSQRCWSPYAELRTSRENGIGLGQFTRAYRTDGSIRFDKISELAAAHKSLRGWSWQTRYDVNYQLTAIVEMDKSIYGRMRDAATPVDRLSFSLSAYNGGEAGVLQDRRLCANTTRCDPRRWTGHVEFTSAKSRVPKPGYRQSFYSINREYVSNVLGVRRPKYIQYFD